MTQLTNGALWEKGQLSPKEQLNIKSADRPGRRASSPRQGACLHLTLTTKLAAGVSTGRVLSVPSTCEMPSSLFASDAPTVQMRKPSLKWVKGLA